MPPSADMLDAAWRSLQTGDLAQADSLARQILQAEPQNPHAEHLLGVVAYQAGRHGEAIEWIGRAIRANPRNPDYFNHLGAAYGASGETNEAVASFRAALRLAPHDVHARFNLAAALALLGQKDDAETEYRAVIAANPKFPQAHYNLGNLLVDKRRDEEAIEQFRRAIELKLDYAEAYTNLGAALNRVNQQGMAATVLRQAIALRPDSHKARLNLGAVLTDRRELVEAEKELRQALATNPESAEAHNNLAVTLMHQGRLEEAAVSADRSLALNAEYAESHANRAAIWLFQGDYLRGWPEYEWRFRSKDYAPNPFREPTWNGGEARGATIVLHAEQGLGDTLQFIRFAELVKARSGATVVFRSPPALVKLLAGVRGIDRIVPDFEPLGKFDLQASLMSLPGILRLGIDDVAPRIPYIEPDPALVAHWRNELSFYPGCKIGVAWQGNPKYRGDPFRSIPLAQLAPLANVRGARLISLQRGAGMEQLPALDGKFQVVDLGEMIDRQAGAFVDTAAIIKNLDLVIVSDTAMAHLAGALGAPVWLALAKTCEWRWMLDRADSPWYPTMSLFRQPREGDWDAVMAEMARELPTLVATRSNR